MRAVAAHVRNWGVLGSAWLLAISKIASLE